MDFALVVQELVDHQEGGVHGEPLATHEAHLETHVFILTSKGNGRQDGYSDKFIAELQDSLLS